MSATAPAPRLSLLLARHGATALIFRRGPSKLVELVRWDTQRDEFERGQWFRGRIYEHRCDLSPNGKLLVYFASKFTGRSVKDREYTYAWTGVSRPPYLTALALWPKGDCWWGGGLFEADRVLQLNHRATEATPHPAHQPTCLRVVPNADAHGEDDPIYSRRLERDGWQRQQEWRVVFEGLRGYRTEQPEIRVREHPKADLYISLTRTINRFRYTERFAVKSTEAELSLPIRNPSWVDWDQRGRLIALADGAVWTATVRQDSIGKLSKLIDLTADRFQPKDAPEWATKW